MTTETLTAGEFFKGESQSLIYSPRKKWRCRNTKHLIGMFVTVTGWYLSWKKMPERTPDGEDTFEPVWKAHIKEAQELIPEGDLQPCK